MTAQASVPDVLSNLVSAIVGAVIGVVGTLFASQRSDRRQRAVTNRATVINLLTATDSIRRELGKRGSRITIAAGAFKLPTVQDSTRPLIQESAHIDAQIPKLFSDLERALHNLAAYDRQLLKWGQIRAMTTPPGSPTRQPDGEEAAMWGEFWETRETCFTLLDSIDAALKPSAEA